MLNAKITCQNFSNINMFFVNEYSLTLMLIPFVECFLKLFYSTVYFSVRLISYSQPAQIGCNIRKSEVLQTDAMWLCTDVI